MPNPGGTKKNLLPMQSVWRHQPTKTVRVPEVLVDKILEYAHKLDKEIPEQRIEINDGWVIVHSPCDPKGYFQEKARSIQGWRFHRRTCSWVEFSNFKYQGGQGCPLHKKLFTINQEQIKLFIDCCENFL